MTPQSHTGKKILCLEDEHFISELYVRALEKAGYDVTVVIDGQKGLSEAQTGNYDIILLDIMLPTMIGTDILARLRSDDNQSALGSKIIITTNLELSEEARAKVEKQADGYIIKAEVTPRQLVEFLEQLDT